MTFALLVEVWLLLGTQVWPGLPVFFILLLVVCQVALEVSRVRTRRHLEAAQEWWELATPEQKLAVLAMTSLKPHEALEIHRWIETQGRGAAANPDDAPPVVRDFFRKVGIW